MGQEVSAFRMETVRDLWSVAQTNIVGSRAKANPGVAAVNRPDTARKGRALVTLTMSAMVRLCVVTMPAYIHGSLWTAAVNSALRLRCYGSKSSGSNNALSES